MKKVVFGLICCILAGCSGEKTVEHSGKIVSLAPAVTEIVLALGGRDVLAGRSSACAEIAGVPVAGDLGTPFVEAVLNSGAGMILTDTTAPAQAWMQLEKCGVKKVVLPAEKLSALPANISAVGKIIGREVQAERLAAEVTGKLELLHKTVPARKKRVLVVISLPPVVTCGSGSFINEALLLAGAENIAAPAGKGYFLLSTEFILNSDPEAVISLLPPDVTEAYFSRNEFRHMRAVRDKHFFYPDTNRLSRMTPQILDETVKLRSLLFGDPGEQQPDKAVKFGH